MATPNVPTPWHEHRQFVARDVAMNETCKGEFAFLAWGALRVILLLFFPVLSLGLVTLLFK